MSDDFIPLNQSTPVHRQWNQDRNVNKGSFQNGNNFHGRRSHKQWNRNNFSQNRHNSSTNSSFSSDVSFPDNSQRKHGIDAYLHPSMLQDPWANLRKQENN